ncbi:MAG: bis(5'-nucleosyl)-tetraphosphatase (symmetrical) YqeK [Spirochaetales bacterium]|nr:bis(5'-nucleosyl)-tetraphosphatase (symmetrical) YqeK [Spirochaetales bacterium]
MLSVLTEIPSKIDNSLSIYENCINLLLAYDLRQTAIHVSMVTKKAIELARRFDCDIEKAETAAVLHDVSVIIPNERRVEAAESLGIGLFEEEKNLPMIIHQRLSRKFASLYFGVDDKEILDAITCHTTLWQNPTRLDMIIFLADKICWDQSGEPPYLETLNAGLDESLEKGAYATIKYMMDNQHKMVVVHPWLFGAQKYFDSLFEKN